MLISIAADLSPRTRLVRVAVLLALLGASMGARAESPPAFKDLVLGMNQQDAVKARKLDCLNSTPTFYAHRMKDPASAGLRKEEARLRHRSYSGDVSCTTKRLETVGGMPAQLRLTFLDQKLAVLTLSINERGQTTYNHGFGSLVPRQRTWKSDNLATLIRSLDDRFGIHAQEEQLDCSVGGCRDAPNKKTLTWRPMGGTVELVYVESEHNSPPLLTYTSEEFLRQGSDMQKKAAALDVKAGIIERATAARENAVRRTDL